MTDKHNKINGSHNVQIVGDVTGNVTINTTAEKQPRPIIKSEPPPDSITLEQRAVIRAKIDEWVETHNQIKQRELTHQAAWRMLNRHMRTPGYTYIKSIDFDKAKSYIQRQIAMLNRMPSASQKNDQWRNQRLQAIHAKCREKGWDEWRKKHMMKKFGVDSMIMLSNDDLGKLYSTVMAKK